MNFKHTPGPWEISWNTFNKGEEHGIYADGEMDLKGHQTARVHTPTGTLKYVLETTQ